MSYDFPNSFLSMNGLGNAARIQRIPTTGFEECQGHVQRSAGTRLYSCFWYEACSMFFVLRKKYLLTVFSFFFIKRNCT